MHSTTSAAPLTLADYFEKIVTARVYDVARETELEYASALSADLGHTLYFKREDKQPCFSFKLRGAYNKIVQLSTAERASGVIAASAGNHAQGVALAAHRLALRATIVMPLTAPQVKIDAVRALGKEAVDIVLHGTSYSDAYQHALDLQKVSGATFVHPFDDPEVIAGQGTVAMEILKQHPDHIDAIFVPIGGGGLIAGMAAYIKMLRPNIRIIGVQAEDSCAMARSLEEGERVMLRTVGLFADGTAVKQVGTETFRLCQHYVDEIIRVDTDALCAAIKEVFAETHSLPEPAGALAVAGAKVFAERTAGPPQTLVAVVSGANLNFDRLRFIAERAQGGEAREALFAITIPEAQGSFKQLCALIGARHVTEFNYRIADKQEAHLLVGLQIQNQSEAADIEALFKQYQFPILDLSHDELAKQHIRHMVGGHSPLAREERLYRFEFPEYPGALMHFLSALQPDWNISLFHYRNEGADYGRILVGLQVPSADMPVLSTFLEALGYPWSDETDNPVYRLFLG